MPSASKFSKQVAASSKAETGCPNPLILQRYMDDYAASRSEAEEAFKALTQFLCVAATTDGPHAPSMPLDDMWHTFILFTRDYREFCEARFGRFIDHEPTGGSGDFAAYDNARQSSERLFGGLNERMWPRLSAAACSARPGPCSPPGQCNPKCNSNCNPIPLPPVQLSGQQAWNG